MEGKKGSTQIILYNIDIATRKTKWLLQKSFYFELYTCL